VEGGGPPPRLAFILNSSSSGASSIKILPGPDGRFVLNLPEDTYRAAWEAPASSGLAFPAGYSVRSFTYAGKNVFTDSFNIDRTNSAEFVVTIAATPTAWTNVSGTVRGLGTTNARIAITGSPVFTLPDVPVAADGSFKLLKVPQGSYMLRLFTASNSTPVTTLAITVGTEEITGLEIIVGR
jgi:hypothetical protein